MPLSSALIICFFLCELFSKVTNAPRKNWWCRQQIPYLTIKSNVITSVVNLSQTEQNRIILFAVDWLARAWTNHHTEMEKSTHLQEDEKELQISSR